MRRASRRWETRRRSSARPCRPRAPCGRVLSGSAGSRSSSVKIDLAKVEEAAKELYIRALKQLPPDVKQGFDALAKSETDAGAKRMLGTMITNIKVEIGRASCRERV